MPYRLFYDSQFFTNVIFAALLWHTGDFPLMGKPFYFRIFMSGNPNTYEVNV